MKAKAKVWFNTLLPANKGDWTGLRVLFLAKFGGGRETSESLWGKVCELRQGSMFEYNVYELQFVELWERWVASLRLGEAALDFLKSDRFVAGFCPPLREKVKGRFPVTWMDAKDIARLKERKIRYQLQQREVDQEKEGMAPVPPTNAPTAHRGQGNQDQQELLNRITHQLEDLLVHLVRGGRAPPPNQEQARGPRRQAQEYHCYNCGENGHVLHGVALRKQAEREVAQLHVEVAEYLFIGLLHRVEAQCIYISPADAIIREQNAKRLDSQLTLVENAETYAVEFGEDCPIGLYPDKEPTSFDEAIGNIKWEQAMDEETAALDVNETWELVPLPEGKKSIGCKWVYKVKHNADGTISRYKARLVAKGYAQMYGINYEETFSPVAKMATFHTVIAVAMSKGWLLHQMDVKNAFLHGDLQEEVYMEQPHGYEDVKHPGYVCKLKKKLYGLKQAPRAWHARIVACLVSIGFHMADADNSLYVRKNENGIVIICIYVDDLIIGGDNEREIMHVKYLLKKVFDMKDLGELQYFLGIEIVHTKEGIWLSQR
ncbi:hypothetical protein L7F22_050806 [Adiantum nelumboides]|nr:hypothetical protein [Adiantum nelumboides]